MKTLRCLAAGVWLVAVVSNAPAWALEVLREHVELAGEDAACPELPVLVCAPVAGDGACGSAIIEVALQDPLVSGVDLATARREIALR